MIDREEIGKVLLHALHAIVRVRVGNLLEKRLGQGVGEVWRADRIRTATDGSSR